MKPMKTRGGLIAPLLLCALLFFLQACAAGPKAGPSPADGFNAMLVMPFQNMTEIYGEGGHVKSPLGNQYYLAGKIEPDGEDYLSGKLLDLLEKRQDIRIISPEDQGDAGLANGGAGLEGSVIISRLVERAEKAGADAALVGYVYKYSNRVGNSMTVSSPASLAFELFLISVKSNAVVWSGGYSETQKSLTEDLTRITQFFHRGPRWITVQEMAGAALTGLLDEIPENHVNP